MTKLSLSQFFKLSAEKQNQFLKTRQKQKQLLSTKEYIDYFIGVDPQRHLTLSDHLYYIQQLEVLLTKDDIQTIFKELIVLYDYPLASYRELQSEPFMRYFKQQDNIAGLQRLHFELVHHYIQIKYTRSLVPPGKSVLELYLNEDDSVHPIRKLDRYTDYPEFYDDAQLFRFIPQPIVELVIEHVFHIFYVIKQDLIVFILSVYYYLSLDHLFLSPKVKETDMLYTVQLFYQSAEFLTSFQASLYFSFLSSLFSNSFELQISFLYQSEKWLQESMVLDFFNHLCHIQTDVYIDSFLKGIGSEMKCLVLQFCTLFQEQHLKLHHSASDRQTYQLQENVKKIITRLTKQNNIHSLCSRYVAPRRKVFRILKPEQFKSHRVIVNNEVRSSIGCTEHQISRQALIEWSEFKDHCSDVINNTSSFWCENCYLDYKQDCETRQCNEFESLEENKARLELIEQCISKRTLYGHFCTWKIDKDHQLQIDQKKKAAENCKYVLQKKQTR